jgi:DNA polymerase III subunit alpha
VRSMWPKTAGLKKQERMTESGHHLILYWRKIIPGYKNLVKLVSLSYTEGFYYKPRIDKELLWQFREGLIVCSACLGGEVPQVIMNKRIGGRKVMALEFKKHFGEDYYLELQRHPSGNPQIDKDVLENQNKGETPACQTG